MASEPANYKEAIISGIMLAWELEIQAFNLHSKQSQVSFAIGDLLMGVNMGRTIVKCNGGAATPNKGEQCGTQLMAGLLDEANDPGWEEEPYEDTEHARASYRFATTSTTKPIRKRPGATRWTQKPCKLLRSRWLEGDAKDVVPPRDQSQDI